MPSDKEQEWKSLCIIFIISSFPEVWFFRFVSRTTHKQNNETRKVGVFIWRGLRPKTDSSAHNWRKWWKVGEEEWCAGSTVSEVCSRLQEVTSNSEWYNFPRVDSNAHVQPILGIYYKKADWQIEISLKTIDTFVANAPGNFSTGFICWCGYFGSNFNWQNRFNVSTAVCSWFHLIEWWAAQFALGISIRIYIWQSTEMRKYQNECVFQRKKLSLSQETTIA